MASFWLFILKFKIVSHSQEGGAEHQAMELLAQTTMPNFLWPNERCLSLFHPAPTGSAPICCRNGFSFSSSSGAWCCFCQWAGYGWLYEKWRLGGGSQQTFCWPLAPSTFPFVFGALSLLEYNSFLGDGSFSITTWLPHGYRIIIRSGHFSSVWCRVFARATCSVKYIYSLHYRVMKYEMFFWKEH